MSSSPILLSSSETPALVEVPPHPFANMLDVVCVVDVLLGTGTITVRNCLKLQRMSVVRLDQVAGSDMDVRVQGVSIAIGEAMIVDESTAVRISSVKGPSGSRGRT
jgi:flagellar motor switch protein FliN/FliY